MGGKHHVAMTVVNICYILNSRERVEISTIKSELRKSVSLNVTCVSLKHDIVCLSIYSEE